jgi:hypothetical protein
VSNFKRAALDWAALIYLANYISFNPEPLLGLPLFLPESTTPLPLARPLLAVRLGAANVVFAVSGALSISIYSLFGGSTGERLSDILPYR